MKKFILSVIFSVVAFSSFAMQATVVSTKGKAEVQNGGSWVALKSGDTLNQGSVIQTGFKSQLVLKIKETTVTVAPLSRVTLQTLAEREGVDGAKGKDETTIFLDTGSLKSNVQKSADRRVGFTVRSPVATASVRGTVFGLRTAFRALKLDAINGRIAFWKNTAKSERYLNSGNISDFTPDNVIYVTKGEEATVTKDGGMKSPSQVSKENSTSIGSGTQSASGAEGGTSTGGSGFTGTEEPESKDGSLTVKIGF